MKLSLLKKKFICLAIVILGIILDYLTKQAIIANMTLGQSIPLWEGVLHITYVINEGAAFSMLSGHRWIFLVVSSVAILGMSAYIIFTKNSRPLWLYSLALIVSGGIGNMIDRISLGYVTDFIDFTLINFAVFNAADSLVCIGSGLLLFDLIYDFIRDPSGNGANKEKDLPAELYSEQFSEKADDSADGTDSRAD